MYVPGSWRRLFSAEHRVESRASQAASALLPGAARPANKERGLLLLLSASLAAPKEAPPPFASAPSRIAGGGGSLRPLSEGGERLPRPPIPDLHEAGGRGGSPLIPEEGRGFSGEGNARPL